MFTWRRRVSIENLKKDIKKFWGAYLIAVPILLWYFIFNYIPMYGALIAFQRFNPAAGIWGSTWVGFSNFTQFFNSFYFWRLIGNTLALNILGLIFVFPAPIIFALLLNELRKQFFKRTVQTITYVPHFISMIVVCGMILDFVGRDGIISTFVSVITGNPAGNLLLDPGNFRPVMIISDIWQQIGWSSIIYLAAIATVDQELYEAAEIDGANRLRKVLSVTIPGIMPTLMILLILRLGAIMNVGFEKVLLLQNPAIFETADVISTFVYRAGILQGNFSYASAIGLFNSVINFIMVVAANQVVKKLTGQSLW